MSVSSLTLCAAGASWALWRRPGVFPLDDGLFWATTGTVLAAWVAVVAALVAALTARPTLALGVGLMPGVMLLAGGLSGRLVFPSAEAAFFAGPFALGVLWLVTTVRAHRAVTRRGRALALSLSALAAPLGVVQATARAPLPADTRPALEALPDAGPPTAPPGTSLSADGALEAPCGAARLRLRPFVEFTDASEDGFWALRRTPVVEKTTEAPALAGPGRRAALSVTAADGGLVVDAATSVLLDVASHLSRTADVQVSGLVAPHLRFDATGATRYPASTYDYPRGRPVHFATFTGDALVVYRATSAEKGPFVELGRGPASRGAPLGITVLEGEVPQCHLAFLDFTAQASTQRSPTAGEGVRVNVVQFGRFRDDAAPLGVVLSLASTGIGSGLETTRHRAGTYRTRVVITPSPSGP
jgi:hypothetical protein